MKVLMSASHFGVKTLPVLVSVLVCIIQIYYIFWKSDAEIMKDIQIQHEDCGEVKLTWLFDAVVKCSLAFIAGCVISDMRFVKFGQI